MVPRIPGLCAVPLCLVALLVGCGSDDGSGSTGAAARGAEEAARVAELIGRLPDGEVAAVVDLAEVRVDLGLEADDDLEDGDDRAVEAAAEAAGVVLPYLAPLRGESAVEQAVDTGQIQGAASVRSDGVFQEDAVAVVATTQDPDEINEHLLDQGWDQVSDDVVADEDAPQSGDYTAAAARDGLVVLGQDPGQVAEVFEREPGDPEGAAALLAEVEGPLRTARLTEADACAGAIAAGLSFEEARGEFLVATGNDGAAEVVLAEGDGFFPGRGVVDGSPLEVDSLAVEDDAFRLHWNLAGDDEPALFLVRVPLTPEIEGIGWLVHCPP